MKKLLTLVFAMALTLIASESMAQGKSPEKGRSPLHLQAPPQPGSPASADDSKQKVVKKEAAPAEAPKKKKKKGKV